MGPPSLHALKATKFEICTKPRRQWVLWGRFSIITHNSPLWKTGTTQFEWIVNQKFQNLNVITVSMGFMRSLFHYYTQITPLESEDHTVWMDFKQQNLKFAQNHWSNGFYEVPFPLLHTNHPLGKRGPHSLNRLQASNSEICMKPLRQWVLGGRFSIITHKSPPWKSGGHTIWMD